LYVWLELPEGMNAGPGGQLIEHSLAEGVLYVPGEYCYPAAGEPVRRDRIRLSFGVQSAENIRRGVESLARAIRRSR
jgi:2-aminoadipate transaminase